MTENNKRNWSKPIWFGLGTISGTLAVLAVGALLLPGAVEARRGGASWGGDSEGGWSRGGGGYGMEMLRKADADDDRKISLNEFKAARGERFAEIDTDGDGAISKDETLNHMIERLKERIDRSYQTRDQDGNGMIDEVEFAERGLRPGWWPCW